MPEHLAGKEPGDAALRAALHTAVMDLPEREREVVLLRLVEGLSTRETALRLRCAEGTVKATLHHATRKLRTQLKGSTP
jgi:RNA polymerase sigma-70 factor (ECF subfamily)